MRRIRKLLVCVMCVLMLCSLAGCGNNTGTANDNLNDATSGENYDGNGENGNNPVLFPVLLPLSLIHI